jgi:hypothetical protein
MVHQVINMRREGSQGRENGKEIGSGCRKDPIRDKIKCQAG